MRTLTLTALAGIPEVQVGDDLAAMIVGGLERSDISLADGDVLVVAQKIVSKAEGRAVALSEVTPSSRAKELAAESGKDPRLVELILAESSDVVRCTRGVIIVEHHLGHVLANAGIDRSNVDRDGEMVLLLPLDPDATCATLHAKLRHLADVAIVINDSLGRPWRNGVTGTALGIAAMPGLVDLRGNPDMFGRVLESTVIAVADELAAAASLLMGQADEGYPVIHARGVPYSRGGGSLRELLRPRNKDLFR